MFVDSGIVVGYKGESPPLMKTRKDLQNIANDRPVIDQEVFKNRENSIGATRFELPT